jgi:hypothetical protein
VEILEVLLAAAAAAAAVIDAKGKNPLALAGIQGQGIKVVECAWLSVILNFLCVFSYLLQRNGEQK